jgi:hypothetical protein
MRPLAQKFNHTKPRARFGKSTSLNPPDKTVTCHDCDRGFLRCVNSEGEKYVHLCRVCRGHGMHEPLTDLQIRKAKYWNKLLREDWADDQPFLKIPVIG